MGDGLPRWHNGKESICQCKRHRSDSWIGKIPWRRKWHSSVLARESHRQRSPVGYHPWRCKESDTAEHDILIGRGKGSRPLRGK